MRATFHPVLLHRPTGDPGAWIDLPDAGRAVIVDLPPLHHVSARRLLKLGHAVVTHTHMDHFIGFDHLLRTVLRRERTLTITGPAGFLSSVHGRVAAYAWNLIDACPVRLRVQEVDGATLRCDAYCASSRMEPVRETDVRFTGTVHLERAFRIEVATFDHGIPVLGVVVRETRGLAVDKDALARRGLVPGPWLTALKDAIRADCPADTPVEAIAHDGSRVTLPLETLAGGTIAEAPGQAVAYLTDLAGTDANLARAAEFVRGADLLLCEAAFLHEDAALAEERRHLTARQAGDLARQAGVRQLAVFHVSPRYEGREADVVREAGEAFGAPVLEIGSLFPL